MGSWENEKRIKKHICQPNKSQRSYRVEKIKLSISSWGGGGLSTKASHGFLIFLEMKKIFAENLSFANVFSSFFHLFLHDKAEFCNFMAAFCS